MIVPFPLLVSVGKGAHHELTIPFISEARFAGYGASVLYDDAALHLMEEVLSSSQEELADLLRISPDTTQRRLKIRAKFDADEPIEVALSVVLRRFPGDAFFEATIPRLGKERFAIRRTSDLDLAIGAALEAHAKKLSRHERASLALRLIAAAARSHEYLDLLEVDLELPTILPKTIRAKRRIERDDVEDAREARAQRRREVPPDTLREVGENVVHAILDRRAPKVLGRDAMVEGIVRRIRRPGAAILLVGPSGSGKSAILDAVLARTLDEEKRLHARRDCWRVDGNRIIAGMSVVGMWEGRVQKMVDELTARGDILRVDDLPSLVWAGRTVHENTNVAGFLTPHLAQGELRILAECTAERLEAARDEAPGFFSHFHVVQVAPLDEPTTLRILVQRAREVESRALSSERPLRFDADVPSRVLALSRRFQSRRALPGGAVALFESLAEEPGEPRAADDDGTRRLGAEHLLGLFTRTSGLPSELLRADAEWTHAEHIRWFERRILGQPDAARRVAEVVTRLRAGMQDPNRPLASMLLVGPTGVGKTETAKALADFVFGEAEGGRRRLLRFDMSELADPSSAARLLGDARRPDGELTRRVRQQPFQVILFDEIEKAHPAIFDALLALLDEGRLTSADGQTTDFTNSVILLTSNLGVKEAESLVGFGSDGTRELEAQRAHYLSAARAFFRPEFFNRLDVVVAYRRFELSDVRPLVSRALSELVRRRGLARNGIVVKVEPDVVDVLVQRGFDPRYGARALRRAVEQHLVTPLARHLLSTPREGSALVQLHRCGETLGFEVWPLEPPSLSLHAYRAPTTFDEIAAIHRRVTDRLDSMEPKIRSAELTRSDLLSGFNAKTLTSSDWHRFHEALRCLSTLEHLREEAANFAEEVLPELALHPELRDFHVPYREMRSYTASAPVDTVIEERPILARHALPTRAEVQRVVQLERDVGVVDLRLSHLDTEPEPVLIRILPVNADGIRFAASVHGPLAKMVSDFSSGITHTFTFDGSWEVADARSVDAPLPAGWAIAFDALGPSPDQLLAPELGFHLTLEEDHAVPVTALIRIERVPLAPSDTPFTARCLRALEACDRAYERYVVARRESRLDALNDEAWEARGALPLRRTFRNFECVDAETGIVLHLDDRLYTELRDVLLTRLGRG